ncbi:MAG TPA: alpha-hydroxy-acid oxidizing protein [Ktedonobacteraceae bacterium]|jgi:hypothetical protein
MKRTKVQHSFTLATSQVFRSAFYLTNDKLDGTMASIDALPEVAHAVAGRCEVYVDGRIRRRTETCHQEAGDLRKFMVKSHRLPAQLSSRKPIACAR